MYPFFPIKACISRRPISSLGPLVLRLILGSQADTGFDMEEAMYYSLYTTHHERHVIQIINTQIQKM